MYAFKHDNLDLDNFIKVNNTDWDLASFIQSDHLSYLNSLYVALYFLFS